MRKHRSGAKRHGKRRDRTAEWQKGKKRQQEDNSKRDGAQGVFSD